MDFTSADDVPSEPAIKPARKLTIKLKAKPKLPENFETETWLKLQAAVQAIHKQQPVSSSLEDLYKCVEDMCYHNLSMSLYKKLENECKQHAEDSLALLLGRNLEDKLSFLSDMNRCWSDHCSQMAMIRSVFLYLDRTYVLQSHHVKSIWDMGLALFKEHIVMHEDVLAALLRGLLDQITSERKGDSVDRSLLKSLLKLFSSLQIFESHFQPRFLESTSLFYKEEAAHNVHTMEISDFLHLAQKRLEEEVGRLEHYLDMADRRAIVGTVEQRMLKDHAALLVEKGMSSLLDTEKLADLELLYALLGRVSSLPQMKTEFGLYIRKRGQAIVQVPEKDESMVQDLLAFKRYLDSVLAECFHSDEAFSYSLKEAFEHFINTRQNKPAELIAKFIDSKLRVGNKGASEEELEETLDRVLTLFRYINGKDVFEAFYKKDLAKRLLLGRSASIDAEKLMITKLKAECGSSFTNKLEGMFKDIDISNDIMSSFKESARNQTLLESIDLYVNVLTSGHWPIYNPIDLTLPPEMAMLQDVFKQFYVTNHNGRRLIWQGSLGHCVVKASFPMGRKELSMSLYQTAVLMLFNQHDSLTYKEIESAVKFTSLKEEELLSESSGRHQKGDVAIATNELHRTLQSLALGKIRVLTKEPKSKDIRNDDVFTFNKTFNHKLFRIKINSIQMKETAEEQQKTQDSVFQDRQFQIDAAIVRIMKTRKTLSHQLLLSEIYQQLKFPIKATDLKKRIESLIDREYLERDPKNSSAYIYLA